MKIETHDDELMALSAIQYCTARHTYMNNLACDWTRLHWDQFKPAVKFLILKFVAYDVMQGEMCNIDQRGWTEFLRFGMSTLTPEDQAGVRKQLGYLDKPFPV